MCTRVFAETRENFCGNLDNRTKRKPRDVYP